MKILIADYDADYRQSVRDILIGGGHVVIEAEDGQEAVRAYKDISGIDLVITDNNMPNRGGLSVIREIKMIQPAARIWLV